MQGIWKKQSPRWLDDGPGHISAQVNELDVVNVITKWARPLQGTECIRHSYGLELFSMKLHCKREQIFPIWQK